MLQNITVKTLSIALAFVGTSVVGGAVSPAFAGKVPMKIANVLPAKAPRSQGADKVAALLNADKRCNISAKTYPGAQLGGTTDLIEGLQIGSIEMVILPGSFLVGFQPLIGIMDFPFFWPTNRKDLAKIHNGSAMKKLLATTTEKGIVSVSIWHTGYKVWTANKPLNKLADYAGLKARVMPSAILKEQDRLLGLTAVGMPFSETYSALQNRAIDAQENPITTNFFMKFYEVQKYMTLTNHGTLDQVIMLSKIWWDKRSDSCKTAIKEAINAGGKLTTDLTYSIINSKALPAFRKAKIKLVKVSKGDYEKMKAKVLPGVERFYLKQNGAKGKKILDAFNAELSKL